MDAYMLNDIKPVLENSNTSSSINVPDIILPSMLNQNATAGAGVIEDEEDLVIGDGLEGINNSR